MTYKKFIVTTTINKPTLAIRKYLLFKDWYLIVVGDLKTLHKEYKKLEKKFNNFKYLDPEYQEKKYKKISDLIGWNCIQRRNIGFLEAYNLGAEIIATVDDDNIPYDFWGKEIYVNKDIYIDLYTTSNSVFDPLSVTEYNYLWHRGFPIQLLDKKNNVKYKGKFKIKVLIQADLWDGDPDIDAIARIVYRPEVKFKKIKKPFASNKISPFNSQNTFLSRSVIPYYACLPGIGRMDDIWGSYILQKYFPNSVIYNKPSVYQKRNMHNLAKDLEKELLGYKYTFDLIKKLNQFEKFLPDETKRFYKEWGRFFNNKT
jgi:hypothetical protein